MLKPCVNFLFFFKEEEEEKKKSQEERIETTNWQIDRSNQLAK
jgi:hypothetical protein